MVTKKHAYLIMVHNNYKTLEKLLELIDDERNDIFIHIDKKTKEIDEKLLKSKVKKSKLKIIKKLNIYWGTYSQVECELLLLEEAVKEEYEYYHLISGSDLPLKTQDYIHNFFNENKGKEFIHFENKKISENKREWISRYHILQKYIFVSKFEIINKMIQLLEKLILKIQKIIKINRYDNSYVLQSGANWFSITHELAKYVISRREWIKDKFKLTRSGDELFLQTIVINSKFADSLYNKEFNNNYEACMRYIDWTRGTPYVFRKDDFEELIDSKYLWARKFDIKKDEEIVNKIYNHIMEK